MIAWEKLESKLTEIAKAIRKQAQKSKFSDHWSWQASPLDSLDVAYNIEIVRDKISEFDWSEIDADQEGIINDLFERAQVILSVHVPNLYAGFQAYDAISAFIYTLELQMGSLVTVGQLKGVLAIPVSLKRQTTLAKQRLTEAVSSADDLEKLVAGIKSAHAAAENLPVTQLELEEAIQDITKSKDASIRYELAAKDSAEAAKLMSGELEDAIKYAHHVQAQLDSAYSAATSQGLAKAFSDRAFALNKSSILWALILFGSLGAAVWIGAERFPQILAAVAGKPDWGVVLVNMLLGVLSLGAPVWMAWLATTQIGQRFRLAEDYGYKAALAAAYEGYRAEAERLDPEFKAKLFATAIGRLDEIPLRLLERDVHGSPMSELLKAAKLPQAIEKTSEVFEKVADKIKLPALSEDK